MSIRSALFMSVALVVTAAQAAPQASSKVSLPAKRSSASLAQSSVLSAAATAPSAMDAKNTALSEENYFPAAKKASMTLKPTYKTATQSGTFNTTPSSKYEVSKENRANNLEITGAIGFTEKHALTIANSLGEDKEDIKFGASSKPSEYTLQGLGDFKLTGKSRIETETGLVFYGASYNWSPEAREYHQGNTSSNRYSGGNSINPYVSFEKNYGTNNVIGWKLSYLLLESRSVNMKDGLTTTKTSMDGGNTMAMTGFNEFHKGSYIVGGSATLAFVDSMTWKANGATAKILGTEAGTLFTAKVYGANKLAGNWELVPALAFSTNLNRAGSNTFETNDEIALNVAARLSL